MKTAYLIYILVIASMLPAGLHANEYKRWTETHYNNENGLPQNSVKFAEMDNDGYLWLATESGIVRYDGQRFRVFDNSNSLLARNRYLAMGKDDEGRIYCVDDYLNISWYNKTTGFTRPEYIRFRVRATADGLIDLDKVHTGALAPILINYRNRFDGDMLYHAIGKQKGFVVIMQRYAAYVSGGSVRWMDSLDCNVHIVNGLGVMGEQLCYLNNNMELILVDTNGLRTKKKLPVPVPRKTVLAHYIDVAFYRQQQQLLLDLGGDIYELALNGGELTCKLLIQAQHIPFRHCVRYHPQQGLLIIGSRTDGLYVFKKQQLATISNQPGALQAFYALAPYGNNQVFTSYGVSPAFQPPPRISIVQGRLGILFDSNKHYWYSDGYTVFETDTLFNILRAVTIQYRFVCAQEDDTGRVWLIHGEVGFGYIEGDRFQSYALDSVEGKSIISFVPAGNQTFWLVGKGLCMWLDVKTGTQKRYHAFDSIELRTVSFDKQGNLWLGSYGQGYFLYRNGRFTKMPEDEAQSLKFVHCFLEDHKGYMWMTTNNGLFQCAINDLYDYADGKNGRVYHHYYGKEAGLKSSEFNGGCTPSGLQLGNGQFAFPSMDGIVVFDPDSINALLPAGKLFIEQVLLDGVAVNGASLLNIPPSFKRLELTVSTPYFGNPRNLHIQYNIRGLDDNWYPVGENNRIVLNQLSHGAYTLRLRKLSGFGADSYVITELPFTVKPFFYQTWWFLVLMGIGLALLVFGAVKIRHQHLVQQRNRLEAEVKDRTSELVYHNKLLEKLALMIAHDLKSPLHFLSRVSVHLHKKIEQEKLHTISRASSDIKNTAEQVYQFVDGFSLWASSFGEGFTIHKTSFALDDLLQELSLFFKEMLEAKGNRLFIASPADYMLHTDRNLLKTILRNIIDNANKHGQHCTISISVRNTEQSTFISIKDTGEGMHAPVLKRIQDRIAQASTAAGIERNSRLGYQMIIDFAHRLSAKLEVESEPGKGTVVTLIIPETNQLQDSANQVVSAG
jgi:Signal transduction histidine kinase